MANPSVICGSTPPPDSETLPSVCPKCGETTLPGYGLMGGGIGAYVLCVADDCDFFAKQQDPEGGL